MEYILERVLPHFAEYPVVLLLLYVLTLFYPRVASYFYGAILGLLVVYGLYHFDDQFERSIHAWLTTSDLGAWFYSFFEENQYRESLQSNANTDGLRDTAEVAFTAGIYFMAKVGILLTLIGVPFAAKTRVKEAIGNIGRRPAKNAPPVL